MVQPGRTVITV